MKIWTKTTIYNMNKIPVCNMSLHIGIFCHAGTVEMASLSVMRLKSKMTACPSIIPSAQPYSRKSGLDVRKNVQMTVKRFPHREACNAFFCKPKPDSMAFTI